MLSGGGGPVGGRAPPLLAPTPPSVPPPEHLPALGPPRAVPAPVYHWALCLRRYPLGLCPDTLFHPRPRLDGPCPGPGPARVPSSVDGSGPRPLLLPWAQLLPPKPKGHSQLKASHWFTQVPPLWQVLLSHTFFLGGQPGGRGGGSGRGAGPVAGGVWRPRPQGSPDQVSPPLCPGPHRGLAYPARCRCWR